MNFGQISALAKRAQTHKDVEFQVDTPGGTRTFRRFDEAAGLAVSLAASDGGAHKIDVLIYSVAGARWYGGDDAVETYREDPDASVSDRIVVRASDEGRIA